MPQSTQKASFVVSCTVSPEKTLLAVEFHDFTFTFHAQWLYDAKCDDGPSRTAADAFCQQSNQAKIKSADVLGKDLLSKVVVTWDLGDKVSHFPVAWLRVMGDLVARIDSLSSSNGDKSLEEPQDSILRTLDIPEFSFKDIFHPTSEPDTGTMTKTRVFEHLLHPSASGLIKIVDLPEPDVEAEKNKTGTIVTMVLKELFGSVFHHPVRGSDKTFNVSSHHQDDVQRAAGLPNYDTSQVLLPHVDHAHYIHPIRVQGWYILEGESENTFVSTRAVIETMHKEEPGLVALLESSPMTVGRVAPYYNPPMLQATVDTVITTLPGFPSAIKRVRWHPHLAGSLVTPFEDYTEANKAHRKFQQIMRRETHQLKLQLRPGDLYLWDNFRILHGRESVGKVPRTGVGQTVPEQVVEDQHRALHMKVVAKYIEERWLVHLPMAQLCHLAKLMT